MGRSAKAYTLAAQQAHRREQSRQYAQSEQSRLLRAASYRRRHSRRGPPHTPKSNLPFRIPPYLLTLAQNALPTTALFREACASATNLDETEVALYDGDPPYPLVKEYTTSEEQYTIKMSEVLSGRKARQLREEERARTLQLAGMLSDARREYLVEELRNGIKRWEKFSLVLDGLSRHRDIQMAKCRLEWLARSAYSVYSLILESDNQANM